MQDQYSITTTNTVLLNKSLKAISLISAKNQNLQKSNFNNITNFEIS